MNDKNQNITKIDFLQSGAVIPFVAVSMILIVAIVALAVDVGYLYVARNELQNAADAAALGATRKLSKDIYQGASFQSLSAAAQSAYNINVENLYLGDDGEGITHDNLTILKSAQEVAFLNQAASAGIVIDAANIKIGIWDPANLGPDGTPFTETSIRPTAVRVTARRDANNVSGNIANFFAGIFGIDSSPVSARATAALTGQSTVEEGELELPIGIDYDVFYGKTGLCGDVIKFSPTGGSCAGWTSFTYGSNDSTLRDILLPDDHEDSKENPDLGVGDSTNYVGGDLSSQTFEYLLSEYWRKGKPVNKYYNPNDSVLPYEVSSDEAPLLCDGGDKGVVACDAIFTTPVYYPCVKYTNEYLPDGCKEWPPANFLRRAHEWETTVIVYESNNCSNPNQSLKIVGFAPVTVFNVGNPPNKTVEARIECQIISPDDTRGGGLNLGVFGTLPGLVE